MAKWIRLPFAIWVLLGAVSGPGLSPARADDVQVNSYTTGNQGFPSMAMDADGDFVVVWHSAGSAGTDSAGYSIQGQRFTSDGSVVGAEFQVNSYTTGNQDFPAVAMDSDGDFVVAWESYGSVGTDSSDKSVQGQRFASDGSAVGAQFQVNSYTTYSQYSPEVALDSDGDFTVVWQSWGSSGTDSSSRSIQGQRYASDGSTAGTEIQINSYTSFFQRYPAVAMDSDGDWVVVWSSYGSTGTDSSNESVQGQRYASDGSTAGAEFQINSYTTSAQAFPSVAMDAGGDFVVAWRSYGSGGTDSADRSVQGQRYASDGSAVGVEFQVNSYTTNTQRYPSATIDADGDFVVVWESYESGGTDSSGESIHGQRYTSDGSVLGAELQVNSYTLSAQIRPSVAMESDGDFVVVWASNGSSGTDSDFFSIQKADATPVPVELISFTVE